jgi:hypothetical protein
VTDTFQTRHDDDTERLRERQDRIARIRAIAAEIRANMPDDVTSDHTWLYDENGFPQ